MAMDAWDMYAQQGEAERSTLTARQRQVLAICDLRQEVNSGGFESYFQYWGGDTAAEALAALDGHFYALEGSTDADRSLTECIDPGAST